jgi:hypothetical protein
LPPEKLKTDVINFIKEYEVHILVILTAVSFIRIVSWAVLASVTSKSPLNTGAIITLPFIRLANCTEAPQISYKNITKHITDIKKFSRSRPNWPRGWIEV